MANVGDRVQIASSKVGREPRVGVVRAVSGNLLTVEWESGEESTLVPASGSISILGRGTATAKAAKKGTKKAARPAPEKSSAKKSPVKKSVARKTAPKKSAGKKAPAKKSPAKKSTVKKAAPKKSPAKKSTKKAASKKRR